MRTRQFMNTICTANLRIYPAKLPIVYQCPPNPHGLGVSHFLARTKRLRRSRGLDILVSTQQARSMLKRLGDFMFRSSFSNWLWNTSVGHSWRVIRLAGMLVIAVILTARSIRLYLRLTPGSIAVSSLAVLSCVIFGPLQAVGGAGLIWLSATGFRLAAHPEENLGHRAGAPGFTGTFCENTLPALEDLIRRDNAGELPPGGLVYVEFDVHETADGELVVLHDLQSVLRASEAHEINAEAAAQLRTAVPDLDRAHVKDVDFEQLQLLHVGGREGLRVPRLADFLECCKRCCLRKSVAVEVKCIHSDEGRKTFTQLLRQYKEEHCSKLERECAGAEYPPFGWLAAISFPFLWAPSFGEFGSEEWRKWGHVFKQAGIPVRSCVVHHLDLVSGAAQ
ncbi:hypothetical protein COCOBI_15-0310 [Coccomyxa sp. Obi]|nr:hypothetical protein COCOBI_15-0310 [Coccomyxa sp. Obi]